MLRLSAAVALLVALVAGTPAVAAPAGDGGEPVPELDLSSPSLSDRGRELARTVGLDTAPRYALTVRADPRDGAVAGRVHANLPAPGADELHFRVFAGLLGSDTDVKIEDVTIAGDPVESNLDASLLTVSVPASSRDTRVDVAMRFSYHLPEVETGGFGDLGETLDPADVGLLGRHQGGATLGHWFPIWLPPTVSAESRPEGFGDLGNFPAAVFTARISVPDGFDVVTSGVREGEEEEQEGGTTFVEEGVGLRDFGVYVGRRRVSEEVTAGDATVRVTGPRSARDELAAVGDEAGASLTTFSETFGAYPWSELDVVSVPLGSGVAGMEWPGMVWIEAGTFAGGLPGFGELPDFGEIFDDLEELFEDLGGEEFDFEDALPDLGDFGGGASSREFTIFHEVAHQWWHALVGNDSITAAVVDEPLAQYSACVAAERRNPDSGAETCASHTDAQYESMRLLGEADAPADQPTDAFTSSLQYGGVVYGKAPGLYQALGELLGADAVLAALRGFATTYAFGIAGPDELRAALVAAAPDRAAEIDALWQRWIEEAHGDEDIGAGLADEGADPGQLEGLDDLQALLELLEGLTTGGR